MESSKTKTIVLMRGNTGKEVARFKKALCAALSDGSARFPGLAAGDQFDADTETALRAWQSSIGLVADGIAGPRCLAVLGSVSGTPLAVKVDTTLVGKLFPFTRTSSIATYLPYVTAALSAFGLTEICLIGVALGTIRAETEGFTPIAELPSRFNTLPGQPPFSAYENQSRLGNKTVGDGARYRGRGFVQLTGRDNYERYGTLLDIPLADRPDSACAPEVAACLLGAFLDANRERLLKALAADDLKAARKVVNGGSHGLDRFSETFRLMQKLCAPVATPAPVGRAAKARVAGAAAPKAAPKAAAPAPVRANLKVKPDLTDLRDRPYMPPPRSLPQVWPADADIAAFIGTYTQAGLILDQGQEGACTGFGLACVVNYLRWRLADMPKKFESVSPRMLYTFARRFDEYEGEDYDGSSCRGALTGWFYNGVCVESKWPYALGQQALPKPGWDQDAIEQVLGVYYRIDPQAITDMQAAIHEVGAIYVSGYTHAGWGRVKSSIKAPNKHAALPLIDYDSKPSRTGGHAFALVGFNRSGFVIQNSWGKAWGAGGFAVISYTDWLAHAMDVWVTAMGVPGVVSGRLAAGIARPSGAAAAASDKWWDEGTAYRHSVELGNNGHVNHFDPLDGVNRTLQNQASVLPDKWFRDNAHDKKRLVLYAHGGLNKEDDAIKRARIMGRYFLGNGCYPLFLVWKSGLLESLGDILADNANAAPSGRGGPVGNWITDKISDPIVEKTIGRPLARPLWTEMKENAELASDVGRGGDMLTDALRSLADSWGDRFELHLMGHSAGSIMLGRLLGNLAQKGLLDTIKSVHLYAPACTVTFANQFYAPQTEIMKRLYVDILSDACEQSDNVAFIYQKSLLYFVSNALEADKRMPILGLENVFKPDYAEWEGSELTSKTLTDWRYAVDLSDLQSRLTVHAEEKIVTRRGGDGNPDEKTENASHGGFDNDVDVVGTTLERITGGELVLPVDDLVGF